MGSANIVSDMYIAGVSRYVPVYQIDLAFALNVMDWLAQDKALSSIRAKAITQRPITFGSESTPMVLEAVNIVGVPLAFILFGVARWRIRSARRARAKTLVERWRLREMEKRTLYALVAVVALGAIAFAVMRAPEKGQRKGPPPRPVADDQGRPTSPSSS